MDQATPPEQLFELRSAARRLRRLGLLHAARWASEHAAALREARS
jgi:hypothetical protein